MFDLQGRTLCVFSHPNHEIAVYGLLIRMRPSILFLTDGGGGDRLMQTETGLAAAKISDITYLNYSEESFYQAILKKNVEFYEEVCDQIALALQRINPAQILCDEVEYYNPVHDIALPLVLRARKRSKVNSLVYSVPLVFQAAGSEESYVYQRSLPKKRSKEESFALTAGEASVKRVAAQQNYLALSGQMHFTPALIEEACQKEHVVPAESPLASIDASVSLRYDRRGREVKQSGLVSDAITYKTHYLPLAESILAD